MNAKYYDDVRIVIISRMLYIIRIACVARVIETRNKSALYDRVFSVVPRGCYQLGEAAQLVEGGA